MSDLMVIYGAGIAGIFLVLMFMYRYALKNTEELGLNKLEIFETKVSINNNLLMASIPLLSILLSLLIPNPIIGGIIGGFTYLLYWPVVHVFVRRTGKKRKLLLEQSSTIGFAATSSD